MIISIGCDNLAIELKNEVINELKKLGHTVLDYGVHTPEDPYDYPDVAYPVAKAVADKEADRGILICGTGIGMAISANKVKGVYAAVCHDVYSTERSILSNDCNVMCMGALVIGKATALSLVRTWLSLTFKESPSSKKIAKFKQIEDGTMEVKLHASK
jgi:ribose 5-phosphate isomerase B